MAGQFNVIHDESTNLERQSIELEKMMDPSLTKEMFGPGDNRDFELPFRINDLRFESSKDRYGLQIADCLAGAIVEVTKMHIDEPCNEDFAKQLASVGYNQVANNILLDPAWRPPKNPPLRHPRRDYFTDLYRILHN